MTRPIPYNQAAHQALLKAAFEATPLEKARLDSAEASLREALDLSPDYARAHGELAYTLVTMAVSGWYEPDKAAAFWAEARERATQAVALDPNDYMSHWNMAHLLVNSGDVSDFDQGVEAFEKAVGLFNTRTDPMERKPGILAEFGEVLVHGGQVDRGVEMIRKALRTPDWYRWSLAFALYCRRDFGGAVAALDEMTFSPGDEQFIYATLMVRGAAEAQRGNKDAAKEAVNSFFDLAPSHEIARHLVAQELARNGFRGYEQNWGGDDTVIGLVELWNEGLEKAGFTSYNTP